MIPFYVVGMIYVFAATRRNLQWWALLFASLAWPVIALVLVVGLIAKDTETWAYGRKAERGTEEKS